MFEEPKICMSPEQLPRQRLRLVVDLPERPAGFRGRVDWLDPMPKRDRPKGSPRSLSFLCSVEWSWSPMHSRWDAYYLNPRGKYWLLWVRSPDDNAWVETWRWWLYAWGPRRGVSAEQAAVYLLLDAWRAEQRESLIGPFLCVNDCEDLSIDQIYAIARRVWPGGKFDDL
jgi:hypothetical protein